MCKHKMYSYRSTLITCTVAYGIYLTGTSLSVIVNIPLSIAIVSSSAATVFYTMFGQMISVAYTDIVQLIFIIIGLVYMYNIYIHPKCSAL